MANRRDFTNQHGAFVPTETQAINNLNGKKPVEEEEIAVKKHKSILTEEDIRNMDRNRKRKTFTEFIKEELKEEETVRVPLKERDVLSEKEKKRRKAEYMKKYYASHKDVFKRANERQYQKKKEARENYCLGEKRSYTDIDLIRLVKVDGKIVGWYRPDGWMHADVKTVRFPALKFGEEQNE